VPFVKRIAPAKWAPQRPEYYVQTGSMFENPHGVPQDEVVRYILENPPEVVAQVVFGKYVENSGLVFTGELIQSMIDRTLSRVTGNAWLDELARRTAMDWRRVNGDWGYRFYTGIDFARQTDYTVITTIDTSVMPARAVYFKRLNRVPWETIYTEVGKVASYFGPHILCDSSGPGGDVVMDALESRGYCVIHGKTFLWQDNGCRNGAGCRPDQWIHLGACEGFTFSASTKKQLVEHLRNVLSVGYDSTTPDVGFGWLRTPPIVQLEEELSFYAWDDKKLETDCLFSLALAAWHGLEDPAVAPDYGSVYGD
jgi:hypothetical protein